MSDDGQPQVVVAFGHNKEEDGPGSFAYLSCAPGLQRYSTTAYQSLELLLPASLWPHSFIRQRASYTLNPTPPSTTTGAHGSTTTAATKHPMDWSIMNLHRNYVRKRYPYGIRYGQDTRSHADVTTEDVWLYSDDEDGDAEEVHHQTTSSSAGLGIKRSRRALATIDLDKGAECNSKSNSTSVSRAGGSGSSCGVSSSSCAACPRVGGSGGGCSSPGDSGCAAASRLFLISDDDAWLIGSGSQQSDSPVMTTTEHPAHALPYMSIGEAQLQQQMMAPDDSALRDALDVVEQVLLQVAGQHYQQCSLCSHRTCPPWFRTSKPLLGVSQDGTESSLSHAYTWADILSRHSGALPASPTGQTLADRKVIIVRHASEFLQHRNDFVEELTASKPTMYDAKGEHPAIVCCREMGGVVLLETLVMGLVD